MDTGELRKASVAVFLAADEAVAKDLSEKLKWAADTIDELRKTLEKRGVFCEHLSTDGRFCPLTGYDVQDRTA